MEPFTDFFGIALERLNKYGEASNDQTWEQKIEDAEKNNYFKVEMVSLIHLIIQVLLTMFIVINVSNQSLSAPFVSAGDWKSHLLKIIQISLSKLF